MLIFHPIQQLMDCQYLVVDEVHGCFNDLVQCLHGPSHLEIAIGLTNGNYIIHCYVAIVLPSTTSVSVKFLYIHLGNIVDVELSNKMCDHTKGNYSGLIFKYTKFNLTPQTLLQSTDLPLIT